MKKSTINYLVDLMIGIAFLISAISGLVFLIPLEWINYSSKTIPTFLGLSFTVWDTLHIWSSVGMMGGVLVHILLHWSWIVNKTKNLVSKRVPVEANSLPAIQSIKPKVTRN